MKWIDFMGAAVLAAALGLGLYQIAKLVLRGLAAPKAHPIPAAEKDPEHDDEY